MSRVIQTPGPSEQLTDRYGVKGAVALRLDEVVVPVQVIDGLPRRPAIGQVISNAVVGFISEVSITAVIPAGANPQNIKFHQIHVTKVHVSMLAAAGNVIEIVRPTVGVLGMTAVLDKTFKEFRLGRLPAASMGFRRDAAAQAGTIIDFRRIQPGAALTHTLDYSDAPLILGSPIPGDGVNSILVRTNDVNEGIAVVFEWSEGPIPI